MYITCFLIKKNVLCISSVLSFPDLIIPKIKSAFYEITKLFK